MLEVIAWKNLVDEKHFYLVQFSSGSNKESEYIKNQFKDWQEQGYGFSKKGAETYILKKEFENTNAWLEWVKDLPYVVNELDKDGKPFRLKTKAPNIQKLTKQTNGAKLSGKKKQCKTCLEIGHNSRTCKKSIQKSLTESKSI